VDNLDDLLQMNMGLNERELSEALVEPMLDIVFRSLTGCMKKITGAPALHSQEHTTAHRQLAR
jgi:hypothetical protein